MASTKSAVERKPFTFLIHTFYATGHVLPTQAIAKELVDRGHRVIWITAAAQEARVLASGAEFIATKEVALCDDKLQSSNPTNMDEIVDALLGGRLLAQVADLRRVLKEKNVKVDCLLHDALAQGAAALFELGEVPIWATIGVIPMYTPNSSPKSTSALGTLLSTPEIVLGCINEQRQQLNLPSLPPGDKNSLHYSPFLHLQASCPSLEFDHNLPETTHFVGPLVTPQNHSVPEQLWWSDVEFSSCVVAVTQGTFAVDPSMLVIPAIEALCEEKDILLIVLSPLVDTIREQLTQKGVNLGNVRFASWLPYDLLLPKCRLLITNGGYGSVTQALALGVPLVCAGMSEDKQDTAARVNAVQAGVALSTDSPSLQQLRGAVREVLENGDYAENAARVAKELSVLGGSRKACNLLEKLVMSNVA